MEQPAEDAQPLGSVETEIKELLGMFSAPAFARRGYDLEYALRRLELRCRREREAMLDMVRVRLRQWASVADGPDGWTRAFDRPIDDLWTLAEAEPPAWADQPGSPRRIRAVARDLVASLERFNRRWTAFVEGLNLDALNHQIGQYNLYYTLEKECILGSARLAARLFTPKPPVDAARLLADHPLLPVPGLVV